MKKQKYRKQNIFKITKKMKGIKKRKANIYKNKEKEKGNEEKLIKNNN